MEVRFTPEEEALLAKIATQEGMNPTELVKSAALRLLEDDARFRVGVRKGVEQADPANSSMKKKWTPASNECSSSDADPLCQGTGRGRVTELSGILRA
jgi:hypothetical protein